MYVNTYLHTLFLGIAKRANKQIRFLRYLDVQFSSLATQLHVIVYQQSNIYLKRRTGFSPCCYCLRRISFVFHICESQNNNSTSGFLMRKQQNKNNKNTVAFVVICLISGCINTLCASVIHSKIGSIE